MARVQPKTTPNWCSKVKPDEPWTGRCVKEKIADDGKRHRCDKKEKHDDNVHACKCGRVEAVLARRSAQTRRVPEVYEGRGERRASATAAVLDVAAARSFASPTATITSAPFPP